jgi:hypothetical protein
MECIMAQANATLSANVTNRPQNESDLLSLVTRHQASPEGRIASAAYSIVTEIAELERLSRDPQTLRLINGEGDDLSLASRRLTALLLRLSALRADQEDDDRRRFEYEMRGQQ